MIALINFLSVAENKMDECLPLQMQDCYRNIQSLVLSNTLPKPLKELYLSILLHTCNTPDEGDPLYKEVEEMLRFLHLTDLIHKFRSNCIRDTTLKLEWCELRKVLEESSVLRGPIYEIKQYLAAKSVQGDQSLTHQNICALNPGELLPPSAFYLQ